jgi:hypothetical protein
MKTISEPLKNTVSEPEVKKQAFNAFLSHFNTLKKINGEFYAWDGRHVDYNVVREQAKIVGISEVPTKEELQQLT